MSVRKRSLVSIAVLSLFIVTPAIAHPTDDRTPPVEEENTPRTASNLLVDEIAGAKSTGEARPDDAEKEARSNLLVDEITGHHDTPTATDDDGGAASTQR